MAGRLLVAVLGFDAALRAYQGRVGSTEAGRRLAAAALRQEAAAFDPKSDLRRIFAAAEAAGLSWPDLADALNSYHEGGLR